MSSYGNGIDLSGLLAGPNLNAGVNANPYGASYLAQMGIPTSNYGSFAGGQSFGIPSTLPGAGGALPADLAAQYGAATAPAAEAAAPSGLAARIAASSGTSAAAPVAEGVGAPMSIEALQAAAGSAANAPAAASWLGSLGEGMAGGTGLLAKGAGFVRGPAGPSILGALAAKGINTWVPSQGTPGNVRSILAGAAQGAGIGTTVGLAGGPLDAVTVPVGAIGGGIIGGLAGLGSNLGWWGGGGSGASDKDLRGTLEANAKMMGLSPSDYTSKFDLATKAGMTDAKGNKLSNQDIANYLGSQMSSEVATTRAQNQSAAQALEFHKADLASNQNLALQSQAFMQPYQNSIISSGINQAQVLNHLADQMPGQYKGVFQAQAATALNQSQQMAAAYAGQTALQPSMQILNSYQQQQQQQQAQANQAMTLAIQMQKAQAGGGAGGVNFATLGQSTTGPNAASGITGGVPGIGMLGGYG